MTAAMDTLLIGPTLALSFATTVLVGKALLRALLALMEIAAKSTK